MFRFIKKIFPFLNKKNNINKIDTKKVSDQLLEVCANRFNYSIDELKKIWIQNYLSELEETYKKELDQKLSELKLECDLKLQQILINSFNRLNFAYFRDQFITKIVVRNPDIRSRLIGLNARNKKTFEKICGVELIIKENDDNVCISSANHVKRTIANNVLNRLIEIKNIEPNKIENYYEEEVENFNKSLISIGQEVVQKLKFKNIDSRLYEYIGKLKYRYSFGQNVLEHSIEVALIAEQIAQELKVDSYLAKLCAFFHDIGKSMDHETGTDHIQLGINIAEKYNLSPIVISSISTHHDSKISNNIYDAITKIADKSSAAKPGARNNSKDLFFQRAKIYEKICMSFNEVKNVWVLQSGFLIKILLKPNIIKDKDIDLLMLRIKNEFETNPETKNYIITVEIIKEDTYQFKTEKYLIK